MKREFFAVDDYGYGSVQRQLRDAGAPSTLYALHSVPHDGVPSMYRAAPLLLQVVLVVSPEDESPSSRPFGARSG